MTDLLIVLTLLGAAVVMFAINKPRLDAVALIMLVALPFTGILTMGEALAGFSDPNIVLIAGLFVLGEGLVRTGVAQRLGDWLIAKAGKSEVRLIVLLMVVVSTLGATMSSTAVTAIFIPVALRISQSTGIGPGRLMMPLSVAALISGMMTLVATAPNLIVNSELERHGVEGFRFFSFTPFGLPVLLLGILYMSVARRWLRDTATPASSSSRPSFATWIDEYKLADREHRLRITARSPLAGKTLDEFELREWPGANIVAIERRHRFARKVMQPTAKTNLQADDVLLIDYAASHPEIRSIRERFALEEIPLRGDYFADRTQEIGLAEVIVTATSDLVGQTIASAEFRTRFNLTVIGLRRGVVAHREFLYEPLAVGDTLLLIGPWRELEKLRSDVSRLVILHMAAEHDAVLPAPGKAVYALACLALVVGLMVGRFVPNVQAVLIGCLLMGVLRCIDFNSAYRSIDWKTIVLIVGMLPFSIALDRTGGVDLAADGLRALTAGTGPRFVLAILFAITALLGMFISNTATAVLMAPVALAVAQELGASPYPFAMIVALAASTAFMTPVSSPVNTLVVAPGHYVFSDFVRIGVPFSLIVLIVSVMLVPWLLPV